MTDNIGEADVWNPSKQISEQITLKNITTHNEAMGLARTGATLLPTKNPLSGNQKIKLRFKGLKEMVSAQQTIISNNAFIVENNSRVQWGKKNKSDEEKLKNRFDESTNDYHELEDITDFLDGCEQQIINAIKTKTPKDDFIIRIQDHTGIWVLELTNKFFDMMKGLELSFKEIMGIMLRNKIISGGTSEDEEVSYNDQENLFLERFKEA